MSGAACSCGYVAVVRYFSGFGECAVRTMKGKYADFAFLSLESEDVLERVP